MFGFSKNKGRRAKERRAVRVRQQAGHGGRDDRVRGSERSGPALAQEPQVSNFQDVRDERHRPRRSHGVARQLATKHQINGGTKSTHFFFLVCLFVSITASQPTPLDHTVDDFDTFITYLYTYK